MMRSKRLMMMQNKDIAMLTDATGAPLLIDWDSKQFGVWLRNFRFVYARLYRYDRIWISKATVYRSKQTGHYHIILSYAGVISSLLKSYYQALFMSDVKKELYYYIEGSNCLFEVKRKRGTKSVYVYDEKATNRLNKQIKHINAFKKYNLHIIELNI